LRVFNSFGGKGGVFWFHLLFMSIFLLSLISSFALGWPAALVLRRFGVIDRPNARSSHLVPTVRGGGVAIIGTIAVGLLFAVWRGGAGGGEAAIITVGVLLLALVSFIDDLKPIGPAVRFGYHGTVAVAFMWTLGVPDLGLGGAAAAVASAVFCVVGFLWLAGYTNAFNFMDGINGLAGGQAVVTGLGTAALATVAGLPASHPAVWLSLLVAGAAAGFLPHNFPRARMFMGDVSSAPLGCLLATTGWWLASEAGWQWLILVGLLHANFVLDTGVTLLRRMARGDRWYEAHREHFYQRLIRAGKSHPYVTGCEMAGQALVVVLVLGAAQVPSWAAAVGAGVLVLGLWTAFFIFAERSFRFAVKA
jgi:UDP-N-acetylmuramyl pentapeptide phosphotransferase/UDP-N-acetylglucosamine-1-phosphate transferase